MPLEHGTLVRVPDLIIALKHPMVPHAISFTGSSGLGQWSHTWNLFFFHKIYILHYKENIEPIKTIALVKKSIEIDIEGNGFLTIN